VTRYNIAMNSIVRQNEMRSAGELKKVRGRFLGVYHAYPNPGYEEGAAVIGLCWSDSLMRWEIDSPCLRPEDGADWENGGLYKPCLVEERGTYYLFYNAKTKDLPREQGGGWREQTGVAISTDLKNWQRFPGNPIIPNGPAGSWDERFASDPCVLLDDKRWAFFYYGLDKQAKARDLLALGEDPFHPVKAHEILIDVGPPGSVDSTYAHKPSVVYHDGALYHFYCAVSGKWPNERRGISVARSGPRRWNP
jgi:beta-xylosidase